MRDDIVWTRYADVEPLTDVVVRSAEGELGVRFPQDFIDLLAAHQGMQISPGTVVTRRGRRIAVGSLSYLSSARNGDDSLTIQNWSAALRRGGYPRSVVPIFDSGGQAHIALDFRRSADRPEIVYAYPDGDAVDTGYWRIEPLADSFDDFLCALEPDE